VIDYLQDQLQFAIKDHLRRAKWAALRDEPDIREHHRSEALRFWRIWEGLLGTPREQQRAIRECRAAGI
jgi:hypothetical protein